MPWLYGYPRENVNWSPTIDDNKCLMCGICMNCGKGVFEWIEGGPVVKHPYNCVVGCSTCANLCQGEAISFPDIKELRELYLSQKIWAKVKKQMMVEGKITTEKKKKSK